MQHNSDDGRVQRRLTTRSRLVEAHAQLLRSGEIAPTAAQIAAAAEVSVRSLWGVFGDMEALLEATSAHWAEEDDALHVGVDPTLALHERVLAFCAERQRRLDYIAPAARAVSVRLPYSPALRHYRARSYEQLREATTAAFGPEIDAAGTGLRDRIVAAASWNTWSVYIDDLGFSSDEARAHLESTLFALIDATAAP